MFSIIVFDNNEEIKEKKYYRIDFEQDSFPDFDFSKSIPFNTIFDNIIKSIIKTSRILSGDEAFEGIPDNSNNVYLGILNDGEIEWKNLTWN